MRCLGYFQDVDVAAAQGLPSLPAGATLARIQCETQSIRYRQDNTNPTASVGMLLAAGTVLDIHSAECKLAEVKIIEAAASAKVNVTYFGPDA